MSDRSPARLLDEALAAEAGRPLLTWYDETTDNGMAERVELSVATVANWVAKTAGLLTDGLDVQPGDRVCLALPLDHWLAAVLAAATWRAGAVVAFDPDGAAVAVTGPDGLADHHAGSPPGDVVAVSLRPLGAPFLPGTLPAGALDYAVEVPTYPDRCSLPWPTAVDPAAAVGQTLLSHDAVVARAEVLARGCGLDAGGRLLVSTSGHESAGATVDTGATVATVDTVELLDLLLAVTVVPLVVGGSCVLVRGGHGPDVEHLAERERVTVVTSWPFVLPFDPPFEQG